MLRISHLAWGICQDWTLEVPWSSSLPWSTCLGLCEGVGAGAAALANLTCSPHVVLGKMASLLFSLFCIPTETLVTPSLLPITPPKSWGFWKQKLAKSVVCKQLLLSALQLNLCRKQITRHNYYLSKLFCHTCLVYACRWGFVSAVPSHQEPSSPSPQAIQALLSPSIIQEALLDLSTERLRHSLSLPMALSIISHLWPMWLFSPIRLLLPWWLYCIPQIT